MVDNIATLLSSENAVKPNLIMEELDKLLPALVKYACQIVIAIVIFLIGRKIISMVKKWAVKTLTKMNIEEAVSRFLGACLSVLMYGVMIFIIADRLGISSASIIALLGSAGIAISLSLQGCLSNFAGGVMILMLKPFKIGDYIVSTSGEGTVKNIGIIYTTLSTVDNKIVTVPNGTLANSPLTNVTASDKRRLIIPVGISYNSDLKKAKEILYKLIEEETRFLSEESKEVYVDELADSAVILKLRGWTGTDDYWPVKWDITEKIKLRFDEAGIEIPFNQLDVNIKKSE
ncbi:MAG: mechanosensitive ion channel [Eubacteriales bacterium]|nr:mechanosensitive ion channel [Eubacteriales bacterium]